jgi:hypothetical protein
MRIDYHPEHLEATYRAIGRFIVEFSKLEGDMRALLGAAARVDPLFWNEIVTHDFALLCTAVQSVFLQLAPKEAEQIQAVIKKCRSLNDNRVRVVHGYWLPEFDGGSLHHLSRGKLQHNTLVEMRAMLEAEAARAEAIGTELVGLLAKVAAPVLEEYLQRLRPSSAG